MASLEDLLAKEGFKGSKMKSRSRTSFKGETLTVPPHHVREHSSLVSSPKVRSRTQRTKSDVPRRGLRTEVENNGTIRIPRNDFIGGKKIMDESEKEDCEIEIIEQKGSNDMPEVEKFDVQVFGDLGDGWYKERYRSDFPDHFQGEALRKERLRNSNFDDLQEEERYKEKTKKNFQEGGKYRNKSTIHLSSFNDNSLKNLRESNSLSSGSSKSPQQNKKFNNLQSQRHLNSDQVVSSPALDEAAVQAMISILTGFIKRFLKDKNFRESLHHNCSSCLGISRSEKQNSSDSGVIVNLKQAIETVEKFAEELENPKELKKASLQLSVIAGLNSNDLKDGFTSGIPNSHFAACAHIYLSVVYKIQKKDRVSAKHLLQVFCDSPSLARTCLLPDLWDHLFLPHISHLRVWYDQEAEGIPNTSSKHRKMELLEKVYGEIVDSGTYQFAVYYKEWLTDGIEAPSIPSIHIPTLSVHKVSPGKLHGLSQVQESTIISSLSSQPFISKKLYEAVFRQSNKLNSSDEKKEGDNEEIYTASTRSFEDTAKNGKENGTDSPNAKNCKKDDPFQNVNDDVSHHVNHADVHLLPHMNTWGSGQTTVEELVELEIAGDNSQCHQDISSSTTTLNLLSHTRANELTLKKLAKAVFQLQPTEDYGIGSIDIDLPATSCRAGAYGTYEYFQENSFFSTIPKDFICPLTGQLFEDPVTLETGQTFEREAIKEWFNLGNRTCPLTGMTLEHSTVPITNFVLKRVLDGWKSEHCKNLLICATQIAGSSIEQECRSKDEAVVFILEQLLIRFKVEERLENAKHLISLGGLQFLIHRFELGALDEKARVAALLSCCIKADGSCRNYIAKSIKKLCLIELLHHKQARSRSISVVLLIELICLNRRTTITSFLRDLHKEGIMNTLHVLLVYLQSLPSEERPLIVVLLLHFELLVEPRKYSIYREEAVDAIIVALSGSLTDQKIQQQTCKALLILGGHFSSSGELQTVTWILKQAGLYAANCVSNSLEKDDKIIEIDEITTLQEEERANEEWLKKLALLLLSNGKKSFLESISKCLSSQNHELVETCLTTVAWLSRALTSLLDTEFHLAAFSSLVPRLKQCLESERVEHRVLASVTLFNFSQISECRVLLTTLAEELVIPLSSLVDVTWTAKRLLTVISGDCQ